MDIQIATIVVTGIGVLIAAVNQIYTSRQANQQRERELETRQAELFSNIYNRYITNEFHLALADALYGQSFTDYADWWQKYGPETNPAAWSAMSQVGSFFSGIGVMVEQDLVNVQIIDDIMGEYIEQFWRKYESLLPKLREQSGSKVAKHIEYLLPVNYKL